MTALYGPVEAVNYNNNASTRGGATVTGLLNQDQHWIVWMRPSAGSSAIKLYGQINTAISASECPGQWAMASVCICKLLARLLVKMHTSRVLHKPLAQMLIKCG